MQQEVYDVPAPRVICAYFVTKDIGNEQHRAVHAHFDGTRKRGWVNKKAPNIPKIADKGVTEDRVEIVIMKCIGKRIQIDQERYDEKSRHDKKIIPGKRKIGHNTATPACIALKSIGVITSRGQT